MTRTTLMAIGLGFAALGSTPAFAQSASPVVVYGNDPCPRSSDSNVIVCKRMPEGDRFRLPEEYRPKGALADRTSWAQKQEELAEISATGVNSCSAVGPGGYTGCLAKEIRRAKRTAKTDREEQTAPIK